MRAVRKEIISKRELKNRLNGVVLQMLQSVDIGSSETLCYLLRDNGLSDYLDNFSDFLRMEKILIRYLHTIRLAHFVYDHSDYATTFRFMVLIEYAKTLGVEL